MVLRRPVIAVCALLLAVGFAACGEDEAKGVEKLVPEGVTVSLNGVDYRVSARPLNSAILPDKVYYPGPPAAKGQLLYGVFIKVCNLLQQSSLAPSSFTLTDNQGNEFRPTALPTDNEFAYQSKRLAPDECIPEVGSAAHLGRMASSMLLFKLPLKDAENLPLELRLDNPNPGSPDHVTYELDL